MVFAVNAPADPSPKSFKAFQDLAISTNGTDTPATATPDGIYLTPSPQTWQTATATVTHESSVWTTTYTSYDGTPRKRFSSSDHNEVSNLRSSAYHGCPAH